MSMYLFNFIKNKPPFNVRCKIFALGSSIHEFIICWFRNVVIIIDSATIKLYAQYLGGKIITHGMKF